MTDIDSIFLFDEIVNKILQILQISDKSIVNVDISFRPDQQPKLFLTRILSNKELDDIKYVLESFNLKAQKINQS